MSLPRSGSFAFGQRERLTVRLANLIRQYQRGPGIIKEFLQNADDAGAWHLRVVMDWRDHGRELPNSSPLRSLLGPALLIANDAEFSDPDFEDIRNIGETGKRIARSKTGRFGLGFNTAYNVTDYPSFLSREWMFCFDPHGDAIAHDDDGGRGFPIEALRLEHRVWLQSFEAAGFESGARSFKGTIFRLPLRSPERALLSKVSREPFDEATFRDIVTQLVEEGPGMLLFTRRILGLTVEEIPAAGRVAERLLSVRTENVDEVVASRDRVHPAAEHELDELAAEWAKKPAPRSTHRHSVVVESAAGQTKSTWQVAIGFYPDPAGLLLEQARKLAGFDEKAIPEAGAAVTLRQGQDGAWTTAPAAGRLYCGLPLPSPSKFPVHVNGFFDLDEARTGLTSDESSLGNAKERVLWNRLLVQHAVSAAYVDAVGSVPVEAAENDPKAFYELWPSVEDAISPMLRHAAIAIHQALSAAPLFRCTTDGGVARRKLADIQLLPPDAKPGLKDPLVADGFVIADPPLPPIVVNGASAAKAQVTLITPAQLTKRWHRSERKDFDLEDAPFPALRRRDWLEIVTRFVISEPKTPLAGLPLALLSNGRLATFGFAEAGTTFIGSETQREIFSTQPHWFIDAEYLSATGLHSQAEAKLIEMSPQLVVLKLKWVLPKVGAGGRREWKATGDEIPNATWLRSLLNYLVENASAVPADDLIEYPLIPDQLGRLHSPHSTGTPLMRSKEALGLISALEALSVPLVSGPDELVQAVGRFGSAFDTQMIFEADSPDIIDTLYAYSDEWSARPAVKDVKVHGAILDCLSQPRCLEDIDGDWLEHLKGFPLFPTGDGRVVSANEPNLFIPSGEQPPKAAGKITLAKTGPRQRWTPLLEKLEIPTLNLAALIQEVLLPSYGNQTAAGRLDILRYIRDNFSRAFGETPTLKKLLSASELIAASNGPYKAASDLFVPGHLEAIALLGDLAAFPNMEVYAAEHGAWMTFFASLGLKE
jgi:hypothetical protein